MAWSADGQRSTTAERPNAEDAARVALARPTPATVNNAARRPYPRAVSITTASVAPGEMTSRAESVAKAA
jgi:hypothetical protein